MLQYSPLTLVGGASDPSQTGTAVIDPEEVAKASSGASISFSGNALVRQRGLTVVTPN
jgi:hypothetical protein